MSEEQMSDAEAEMVAAMEAQAELEKQAGQDAAAGKQYEPPAFENGQSSAPAAEAAPADGPSNMNLEMILDVPITLSMEVGRSKLPIRNLMQLNPGSVVELDRIAGQPLDVFVNGTLIAHGEVVVVNEKFGVRLIDVVSPAERIRKLQA